MIITAQAAGKLFLAGEYAITEPTGTAIVAAVDQYLNVQIEQSTDYIFHSDQFVQPIHWDKHSHIDFITPAITLVERMSQKHIPFTLTITSELDATSGKKYGLGSSGALSVALIKGLLTLHAIPQTPLLVYKLAVLANLHTLGSYGDIAASAYHHLIFYQAPDKNWLLTNKEILPLNTLLDMDWPLLQIEPLHLPTDICLHIGWTGTPYSTSDAVAHLQAQKQQHSAWLANFVVESNVIVQQFKTACATNNSALLQTSVRANRTLLQQFAQHMQLTIETATLQYLCDSAESLGIAAKTSGAGGGDCGIAFATQSQDATTLEHLWTKHNIVPLPFKPIQHIGE